MNFFDVNHFFPASAFAAGSGLFTSRPLLKRPVLPGGLLVDTAHQYAHLHPKQLPLTSGDFAPRWVGGDQISAF